MRVTISKLGRGFLSDEGFTTHGWITAEFDMELDGEPEDPIEFARDFERKLVALCGHYYCMPCETSFRREIQMGDED